MEWTKSETIKFINLFHEFPCLWNSKNKDYKNRLKRRDALEYIAQEANANISAVEKKIISLRTQYNREIHKIKTKSESGYEEPTSSWYAFDLLHFLKDNSNPRPSTDSFTITFTPNQKEEQAQDSYDSSTNLSTSNINEQFPKAQPERRSKIRKSVSQMKTLNLLKHASNAIINRQKKDDFSIFGEVIASELRDMKSKKEVIELKKNIMNMIYITKMKILDVDKPTSTLPSPNPEGNSIEKENTSVSSDFHLYVGKVEVAMDGEWMK